MRKLFLSCACALALAIPAAVVAQQLPRPKEFYFDDDAAVTRPIVAIEGSDGETIAQLARLMERGGRNSERAIAQLAHLSMASGRIENGRALYANAVAAAGARSQQRHAVQWNYAWDLYRAGDFEGALAQWQEAFANRLSAPSWVPPTMALALWKLDRRRDAVDWYAAAVRTEPQLWSDAARLPSLLPDWTAADLETLAEVHAAWVLAPPSWP